MWRSPLGDRSLRGSRDPRAAPNTPCNHSSTPSPAIPDGIPPTHSHTQPTERKHIPLILYSPVSWLLLPLRMLNADEAPVLDDPTVSTRSNPGCATSLLPGVAGLPRPEPEPEPGRRFSSCVCVTVTRGGGGRRVKGLRMGILKDYVRVKKTELGK